MVSVSALDMPSVTPFDVSMSQKEMAAASSIAPNGGGQTESVPRLALDVPSWALSMFEQIESYHFAATTRAEKNSNPLVAGFPQKINSAVPYFFGFVVSLADHVGFWISGEDPPPKPPNQM